MTESELLWRVSLPLKEMTVCCCFFFFKEKPVGLTLKASINAPIVYDVCVFKISCTNEMETNYPRKNRDCIVFTVARAASNPPACALFRQVWAP